MKLKVLLYTAILISLFACTSVPQRPRSDYRFGSVTIILTDPDEIWNKFGCEGRVEILPEGNYRIWSPMPDGNSDRHALEVLGHEMMHVLNRSTPIRSREKPELAGTERSTLP